jgi:hypothetical protein
MSLKRGTVAKRQSRNAAPRMKLTIHHQFPGIELVSPDYAIRSVTCYLPFDQRIDAGSTMQTCFNIDTAQEDSIGVLLYRLQRKNTDQTNEKIISSKEEATCIQLVIVWRVTSSKEFHVVLHLIEHDKGSIWDRNRLMKLVESYKLFNIRHGLIEDTWLMYDDTVLMTRANATCEKEYYKLEMTVSDGSIKDDTWRPQCVDLDRRVLMMVLVITLTYYQCCISINNESEYL